MIYSGAFVQTLTRKLALPNRGDARKHSKKGDVFISQVPEAWQRATSVSETDQLCSFVKRSRNRNWLKNRILALRKNINGCSLEICIVTR